MIKVRLNNKCFTLKMNVQIKNTVIHTKQLMAVLYRYRLQKGEIVAIGYKIIKERVQPAFLKDYHLRGYPSGGNMFQTIIHSLSMALLH